MARKRFIPKQTIGMLRKAQWGHLRERRLRASPVALGSNRPTPVGARIKEGCSLSKTNLRGGTAFRGRAQHDVPIPPLIHKMISPILRPTESEFLSPTIGGCLNILIVVLGAGVVGMTTAYYLASCRIRGRSSTGTPRRPARQTGAMWESSRQASLIRWLPPKITCPGRIWHQTQRKSYERLFCKTGSYQKNQFHKGNDTCRLLKQL